MIKMAAAHIVTPELRIKLKEPFGSLIQGAPHETMAKLGEKVEKEKPPMIISVGDIVTQNLHKHSFEPNLSIVDNISQRNQLVEHESPIEKTIYVKNPQGTITTQAISAIKKAIKTNQHTHIVVDGEEDLLTLVTVLFAPENSFVVYGQPNVGVVVVKATLEKKALAEQYLNSMKATKS